MTKKEAIDILCAFAICHSKHIECKYCPLYESGDEVDGVKCKQSFIGYDGRTDGLVEDAVNFFIKQQESE